MDNAQQIANEVAALRAQAVVLAPSAEIGALEGQSSVDAAGQAHYSIPIEVTPGPRGTQPAIAIEYASNDGNGSLGNRFDLAGFSAIHRCPENPAQDGAFERIAFDDDDPLCLDGERLILVAGTHGTAGAEYRPRRGPFERVVLDDGIGDFGGTIMVSHSDGQVSRFGEVPASLWVGNTQGTQIPWRWGVRQTCDRWNNCIDYEYEHGPDLGNGPSDLRAVAVRYGGTGAPASRRAVEIVWDDRPDTAFQYESGALLRRSKVVSRIDVRGPSGVLVRRYGFDYTPHAQTGRLRLIAARVCDAAGACLPDTTFEWSEDASSTLTLDPWVDEEGNGGIWNLGDEMGELLEARAIVAGDFDLGGDDELLFPTKLSGNPWLLWFTSNETYPEPQSTPRVWLPAVDEILPLEVSESPQNLLELIGSLRKITPPFRPATVSFGGSVLDDILIPVGEAWASGGDGTDSGGIVIAEQLAFFADVGPGGVGGAYIIEDDSQDPIYQIVPLDHDGDMYTDVWLCRGPSHDAGTWTLAHRVGTAASEQEDAFEFLETDVACSVYDEWTVSSVDGGPAGLLVIAAYDEDGEHVTSENRGDYRRVRLDIETGESSLEATGLPRDIYQRTHDALCRNALVETASGSGPLLGAGRSHDHQIDLNDDGLVDVLRFQLAEGDGVASLTAIRAGLLTLDDANDIQWHVENELLADPTQTWSTVSLCTDDPDLVQDSVIATYYNTGAGFTRGPNAVELSGNAHAQFWLNFVGAIPLDLSDDGRTDLIMPATGPGTDWSALITSADGELSVTDLGNELDGWPSYDSDATWHDDMELGQRSYVTMLDGAAGRRSRLVFVGVIEDSDAFPDAVNVYRVAGGNGASAAADRIEVITNGVGARIELSYDPKWLPTLPSAIWPKASLTEGVWVTTSHAETVNPAGDLRIRNYTYADAEVDRTGRGLLGFRRVDIHDGPIHTTTTYDQSYDDALGDYPLRGRPIERLVIHELGTEDHVQRTSWTWGVRRVDEIGGDTYFAYPEAVEEVSAVAACSPSWGCGDLSATQTYLRKRTTQSVDDFGTVLTTIETYTEGEGPVTQVTNSDIVHDEASWILGKVGKTATASCRNGTCNDRTIERVFDEVTGAVERVILQPDDPLSMLVSDFHRDARGNVDGITHTANDGTPQEESRVTVTMWDAEGVFPLHTTNGLGHRSYVVHHPASGVQLATVDAAGLTNKIGYDGLYRAVRTSLHSMPMGPDDGAPSTVEYLAEDPGVENDALVLRRTTTAGQRVLDHVSASGHVVQQSWRGMAAIGAALSEAIPPGALVFVGSEYDARGRRVARTLPAWVGDATAWDRKYERSFDALDRVTSETAPDGTVLETREYEHRGELDELRVHVHTTQGAAELVETVILDSSGLPRRQIDAGGTWTCFEHGPFEQLASTIRNCNGATPLESTTEYDDGGRITRQIDPALGERTSEWNAFGELVAHEDAEARLTKYSYDALGRLHHRYDPDGTATFTYDTGRLGALGADLSPDGIARTLTYDEFGRPKTTTTTVATPSGNDQYQFEWTYGPGGRIETIAYPRPDNEPALTMRYVYDQVGHLRGVRDQAVAAQTHWIVRAATPADLPTFESYGNGAETRRDYDPERLWVERIRHGAPQGTLTDLRYTWLPEGELDRREEAITQQVETFGYDTRRRLTGATIANDGGSFPRTFAYDDHGNLTSMTDVGAYEYHPNGRLKKVGGVGVTMDDSGSVIKHGAKAFEYTAFGKVRKASDATTSLTMAYDAQGERVRKRQAAAVVPDTVTLGMLYERKVKSNGATSSITYRVAAGDRIVSQVVRQPIAGGGWGESLQYVHDDHLGSTVRVTSKVGNAVTTVATSSSDPWGRARVADKWQSWQLDPDAAKVGVGFTGHRAELDLGLIDMGGRMYDPRIARFTTGDPLVVDPYDGAAYNRFAYVGNRPLRFTDPTGWAADGDTGGSDEEVASDDGDDAQESFDAFIAWLASHPSGAAIANALGMGGALLNEMYQAGLRWKALGVETISDVYEIAKLIATDRRMALCVSLLETASMPEFSVAREHASPRAQHDLRARAEHSRPILRRERVTVEGETGRGDDPIDPRTTRGASANEANATSLHGGAEARDLEGGRRVHEAGRPRRTAAA